MRQRAINDAQRREDESSAAAASNLVDFFQSAAQRWRGPVVAESAPGGDTATQEASVLASDGSIAADSREAVQSQVPDAAENIHETAAELAHGTSVADPLYRVPVLAAIQSWQPSAGSTVAEASGAASPSLQTVVEPQELATAQAHPVLASPGADAPQQAVKPAAASGNLATAPVIPVDSASAVAAPVAQKQGEKGAPDLITPPKEAIVPNAASRPFSADTA